MKWRRFCAYQSVSLVFLSSEVWWIYYAIAAFSTVPNHFDRLLFEIKFLFEAVGAAIVGFFCLAVIVINAFGSESETRMPSVIYSVAVTGIIFGSMFTIAGLAWPPYTEKGGLCRDKYRCVVPSFENASNYCSPQKSNGFRCVPSLYYPLPVPTIWCKDLVNSLPLTIYSSQSGSSSFQGFASIQLCREYYKINDKVATLRLKLYGGGFALLTRVSFAILYSYLVHCFALYGTSTQAQIEPL
jgi:hypothetical protein